jgi:hypothetical protein
MDSENDGLSDVVLLPPMALPRTLDVSARSRVIGFGLSIASLGALPESVNRMKLEGLNSNGIAMHNARFFREPVSEPGPTSCRLANRTT